MNLPAIPFLPSPPLDFGAVLMAVGTWYLVALGAAVLVAFTLAGVALWIGHK